MLDDYSSAQGVNNKSTKASERQLGHNDVVKLEDRQLLGEFPSRWVALRTDGMGRSHRDD